MTGLQSANFLALTAVTSLLAIASVVCQSSCGLQMPQECKLYIGKDCRRRYAELKHPLDDTMMTWPDRMERVHVQPYSIVSHHARDVSLAISWAPPQCSFQHLRGIRLSITALDDVSRYTLCRLFDTTSAKLQLGHTDCLMSYNLTLPRIRGVYNWHMQLESLPSPAEYTAGFANSVTSAIVTTDQLDLGSADRPPCKVVPVVYIDQNSINVTLSTYVASDGVTSYDVILYECDTINTCCDVYCSLTQVGLRTVTLPSSVVSFAQLAPWHYRVYIQPAGQPDHVCVRTAMLNVTKSASSNSASPPQAHIVTAKSTTTVATNARTTEESWLQHTTAPVENSAQSLESGLDVSGVSSWTEKPKDSGQELVTVFSTDHQNWKLVVVASVGVSVTVVILLAVAILCYCRRRPGQPLRCISDLHCMQKLVTSSANPSINTLSDQNSAVDQPPPNQRTLPAPPVSPSPPPVKLCLLSHSSHPPHAAATDALARYLQASCACDVTYFRWQLEDVEFLGPQLWAAEQLDRADCVVFVHSPDVSGQGDGQVDRDRDVAVGILSAVFQHVSRGTREAQVRWFNVAFQPDLRVADGVSLLSQFCSPTEGSVCASQCLQTGTAISNPIATASKVAEDLMDDSPSPDVYLLMDDFSRLLADLHDLPSTPSALRERTLPLDTDHRLTREGKQLCHAITSLRLKKSKKCAIGDPVLDSDFAPLTLSFEPPEDVSMADSEQFRAINMRYELRVTEEEEDCYNNGGSYL